MRKEKFAGLEWLRFGLALLLVVYHTLPFYPGYKDWPVISTIAEMGIFSTVTFFTLSGFLMTHVYLPGGQLRGKAGTFLFKRFANLYPIHILTLAFALALTFITQLVDHKTGLDIGYRSNEYLERIDPELLVYPMSASMSDLNWFLQLTALHAWNPLFLAYNGPSWSISTLFFFYLLFPVIGPWMARVKNKWRMLAIILAVAPLRGVYTVLTESYTNDVIMGSIHHVPLFQIGSFLAGITGYFLFKEHREQGVPFTSYQRMLMWLFLVTALSVAAILNWYGGIHWHVLIRNGLLLPLALLAVVLFSTLKIPDTRIAQRLGAASLSIFALHIPLFVFFRRTEMVLSIDFGLCFTDVSACVATAREHALVPLFYPFLVVLIVILSVLFQERVVVVMRDWLLSKPWVRSRPIPSDIVR